MKALSSAALNAPRMTDSQLFAAVRALGLSIRKSEGEYRIAFKQSEAGTTGAQIEASAYYTYCRTDALATARRMRDESPLPPESI